jgi:hypothetical protein
MKTITFMKMVICIVYIQNISLFKMLFQMLVTL